MLEGIEEQKRERDCNVKISTLLLLRNHNLVWTEVDVPLLVNTTQWQLKRNPHSQGCCSCCLSTTKSRSVGKHLPFCPSSSFPLMPPSAGPKETRACKGVLEIQLFSVQSSTSSLTPVHKQDSWKWKSSTREIMTDRIRILLLYVSLFPFPNHIHDGHAMKGYFQLSNSPLRLVRGGMEVKRRVEQVVWK